MYIRTTHYDSLAQVRALPVGATVLQASWIQGYMGIGRKNDLCRHTLNHILPWNLDDFYRPKLSTFKIGVRQNKKPTWCQVEYSSRSGKSCLWELAASDTSWLAKRPFSLRSLFALLNVECTGVGVWDGCAVQTCEQLADSCSLRLAGERALGLVWPMGLALGLFCEVRP